VAQCHGVVAGHAAQRRTVAGMASPGELAEQGRGVIPRRVVDSLLTWTPANVSALNVPVRGVGMEAAGP
jgi:hypothetical protein